MNGSEVVIVIFCERSLPRAAAAGTFPNIGQISGQCPVRTYRELWFANFPWVRANFGRFLWKKEGDGYMWASNPGVSNYHLVIQSLDRFLREFTIVDITPCKKEHAPDYDTSSVNENFERVSELRLSHSFLLTCSPDPWTTFLQQSISLAEYIACMYLLDARVRGGLRCWPSAKVLVDIFFYHY
jgi:hypothetical protein